MIMHDILEKRREPERLKQSLLRKEAKERRKEARDKLRMELLRKRREKEEKLRQLRQRHGPNYDP